MAINREGVVPRDKTAPRGTGIAPVRKFVRLFVARGSANSRAAETNLRSFLAAHPELIAEVEFIDVREDPEAALSAGVFVTPTLIRSVGDKTMIAVGNLHDVAALVELFS
jgi:hypothetical protein